MANRLMVKGAIGECKERLEALEVKIEGLCSLISDAAFIFDGVKSIKMERLNGSVKELNNALKEYASTERQLKKLRDN